MLREKIVSTLLWAACSVAAAMLADFAISILILNDPAGYTPLVTLSVAIIVSFPVTYVLVSSRLHLRDARDDLALARDEANAANHAMLAALQVAEDSRSKAEREREAAINASLAKSQFLANMSHELRTPLNAILGFSEMLTFDNMAARRQEYARLIHGSGTHLLGLVNDILDLARIEAEKVQLHDEKLDVAAIVEPRAAEKDVRIAREIPPALPEVLADRRAIKQILLNLLSNAVKFSTSGGTVTAFAYVDATGELAMGVRDNGVGIAKEDQAHVFERFGQGRHDIASLEKGTGLGLPIVKGLAEAHGGRVAMVSKVGEGTCVTIWLPASRLTPRALVA